MTPSIKQWKEFKTYRFRRLTQYLRSSEHKHLMAEIHNLNNPDKVKRKFLWWEWEEVPQDCLWLHRLSFQIEADDQKRMEKFVGPETVEACLNWLVNKK